LWEEPGGIESTKADSRFWSAWQCYSVTGGTTINLFVDGVGIDANGNQYTNAQPYTIAGPTGIGYFVSPPLAIGQQGVITGMTIFTNAEDMALISAKIAADNVGYRG